MLDTAAPPELLKQLRIYPGSMRTQRALFFRLTSRSSTSDMRADTESCVGRPSAVRVGFPVTGWTKASVPISARIVGSGNWRMKCRPLCSGKCRGLLGWLGGATVP